MEMTHKFGKTQITAKTVEVGGEVYGEVFFELTAPLVGHIGPTKQRVGQFTEGFFRPALGATYSPALLRGLAALLEVWENPQ